MAACRYWISLVVFNFISYSFTAFTCERQLFPERLSYQRGKAYATMSKVIMGNGDFYTCLSERQGASTWWKETAQTSIRSFSVLIAELPWTSIKQSQTLTSHNANRHCRVRFYTFVGQPLSKLNTWREIPHSRAPMYYSQCAWWSVRMHVP